MKIAIVCDWLVSWGGAEKVISHLLNCFPDADLFAVVDFITDDKRQSLLHKTIKTTFIQQLPFAKTKYRFYLPLMPLAIEQLDLSGYDLILSNSHAVAKGVITGPDQVHISYVHSPMRYAWDLQHQYLHETGLDKKWSGWLVRYFLHKLRLWDFRSGQGADHLIANSHYIARRIKKNYRREATVIYPPVDLTQFQPGSQKDNFFLTASRLVPYKRIDLIAESFAHLPGQQLVIIGDGPELAKIKAKSGNNVQVLGFQSDDILLEHLQRARAFIFAAEEDFGLLPIEAQACGTPVIAFGKGGALETVRGLDHAQPSGIFFNEQSVESIVEAIHIFLAREDNFQLEYCTQNAQRFSPAVFYKEMKKFVESATEKSGL